MGAGGLVSGFCAVGDVGRLHLVAQGSRDGESAMRPGLSRTPSPRPPPRESVSSECIGPGPSPCSEKMICIQQRGGGGVPLPRETPGSCPEAEAASPCLSLLVSWTRMKGIPTPKLCLYTPPSLPRTQPCLLGPTHAGHTGTRGHYMTNASIFIDWRVGVHC